MHEIDYHCRNLAVASDLHLGSMGFDSSSWNEICRQMVEYVKMHKIRLDALVINGDALDNQMVFREQPFNTLPTDVQILIGKEVLTRLANDLGVKTIYILAGNHDIRCRVNLASQLVRALQLDGLDARYFERELILSIAGKRIIFSHAVPRTYGSYTSALTPKMITDIVLKLKRYDADLCVMGHYHRFNYSSLALILPSFVDQTLHGGTEELFLERGAALIIEDKEEMLVKPFLMKAIPAMNILDAAAINLQYYSQVLAPYIAGIKPIPEEFVHRELPSKDDLALDLIRQHPGITKRQVAQELGLSFVQHILDRLKRRGLIGAKERKKGYYPV